MKTCFAALGIACLIACLSTPVVAQLPAPNADGVSSGHTHLVVPNVAKHREIWKLLGGVERSSGRLQALMFPGMFILLREGEPSAPSIDTTANHIGFTVNDYALYKAKLEAVGASIFFDDGEGQILADLDAFAAKLDSMGIAFDRAPECIDAINLCIAFITDPKGTYIELTQGLVNVR